MLRYQGRYCKMDPELGDSDARWEWLIAIAGLIELPLLHRHERVQRI